MGYLILLLVDRARVRAHDGLMIIYRANTKAGRAWISTILANATQIRIVETNLLTDERTSRTLWRDTSNGREGLPSLLRDMFADRYVELFDMIGGTSTYLMVSTARYKATRYEITVFPFDPSDLPTVKAEEQ